MKSLLLDRTAWDLVLDTAGNIAVASEPYAIAQDVATAVRTFAGEVWYDTTIGVPYFEKILGQWPPAQVVKTLVVQAAMTVPGVVQAQCTGLSLTGRTMSGQIQIIDAMGVAHNVSF